MSSGLLAGPLLALLLAQAEPAPPTPTDPGPAPGPSAPVGPAEPAPLPSPSPPGAPPAALVGPDRAQVIGIALGATRRVGQAAKDIPPRHGLVFSSQLGRRYLLVDDRVDLGLAFQFGFSRFATDVSVSAAPGQPPFEDVRTLTYYDLALLHTAALMLGPVRPFLAAGGGISLAHFSTIEPHLSPGEARTTRALLLGALGLDVMVIGDETRVGLELDGSYLIQPPSFAATDGRRRSLFGSRLALALWLRHAF
jgi:hypothetical protein